MSAGDTAARPPARGTRGPATAADLLRSAYPWERDRRTITLGEAVQRFRDVNGYVGLPVPAPPAFLKVFRRLINGRRPPERIYLIHDASHVLTGTAFTHAEPPLVLLAAEAAEQGMYFASRGVPRAVGLVLFYGGALLECLRGSASIGQVARGVRLRVFTRAYDHARRTRLTNLFEIPIEELWHLPIAEARARLRMPENGVARELYRDIAIDRRLADRLRREWKEFGHRR